MARNVKNYKTTFYKYVAQKRQAKANVPPLVNVKGELVSADVENAEVLNEFLVSVFTGSQDSDISYIPELWIPRPLGGEWGTNSENAWVLKELAEVVAKPLTIIFEKLWLSGDCPG